MKGNIVNPRLIFSALSCLALAAALSAFPALPASAADAAGGTAKGKIQYKDKTVELKYAYLITGPDMFDSDRTETTVILSPADISGQIAKCESQSCAGGLTEGMTLSTEDFGGTVRVVYWVVTNDGLMQYSGNTDTSALTLTTDAPGKKAGKMSVDASAAGGPKIDVEFDAPLTKAFKE
ncbi:MAG TPA: hypothetical protein PKC29_01180 [Thermodesulfobacteriota bacterium]|nr:hypothetical protein [Thermodesulfobacteriota bacterium]